MRTPSRTGRAATQAPGPPTDRIEGGAGSSRSTWDSVLVWFMRLTALAWLVKAVLSWAAILDVWPGARRFDTESFGRQAVLVYFAVIDPAAAIGLWMTSAWGGVIWLLAVTSTLTLAVLTPQLLPMPLALLGSCSSIVMIYFLLSFMAAREIR